MRKRPVSALIFCLMANIVHAAEPDSAFCAAIKALPLEDIKQTEKLLHGHGSLRTSNNNSGNGRSLDEIERVAAPYLLSPELQQIFKDNADAGETDYDFYKSPDGSLFQFTDVQGSMECAYDIWATRRGSSLELVENGPDLGEACDAVRIYGVFKGKPVLVQYLYRFDENDPLRHALNHDIDEIRAVELLPDKFNDVCIVKPG